MVAQTPGKNTRIIAVEPTSCPTLTKGKFAYDYGDVAGLTPIMKMHTQVGIFMIDEGVLDLDYPEDAAAAVDMNVVMTGSGQFVEIQGTGEESTFDDDELASLIKLARDGIGRITQVQQESLGADWPFG